MNDDEWMMNDDDVRRMITDQSLAKEKKLNNIIQKRIRSEIPYLRLLSV